MSLGRCNNMIVDFCSKVPLFEKLAELTALSQFHGCAQTRSTFYVARGAYDNAITNGLAFMISAIITFKERLENVCATKVARNVCWPFLSECRRIR